METETLGDPADPDLACVLGWGNRLDHENVRWLLEALATDSHVTAVQIPITISDFEAEYLDPVREIVAGLDDDYRFVGHSTGGLIGAYLRGETGPGTRTYLSPWWGMPPETAGPLLGLITRLPTSREIVPTGTADREALGELATDRQIREGPTRAAPTFLREARRAQAGLADVDSDPDAVAFCTLADRIVDPRQVSGRVDADRVVLYDGGHELFSSTSRDDHLETLRAVVREGPAGLS